MWCGCQKNMERWWFVTASLGPASEQILSFQFQFIPWRSLCPEFQPQLRSPSIPRWAAQSNVALNAFCLVLSFTFIPPFACQDKHTCLGTSGTQRSDLNGQSVPLGTHCGECHLSHQHTWILIWTSARGSLWDVGKNYKNKLHHYGYVVVTWSLHRFHKFQSHQTQAVRILPLMHFHTHLFPIPEGSKDLLHFIFSDQTMFFSHILPFIMRVWPPSAPVSWNNQNLEWKVYQGAGLYRSFAKWNENQHNESSGRLLWKSDVWACACKTRWCVFVCWESCLLVFPSFCQMPYARMFVLALTERETGAGGNVSAYKRLRFHECVYVCVCSLSNYNLGKIVL